MPHDGNVLQRWAQRVGLQGAARPERLLATRIGWDCAGAVQFCGPEDVAALRARPGGRRPAGDDEIAEALRTAVSDMGGGGRDQPATAQIGRDDWENHARRLGFPAAVVLEGVTRIAEEAAPAAQQAAADCHEPAAGTFPERYAAAVAHWQQHCLDALTTTPHPRPRRPGSGLGLSCVA